MYSILPNLYLITPFEVPNFYITQVMSDIHLNLCAEFTLVPKRAKLKHKDVSVKQANLQLKGVLLEIENNRLTQSAIGYQMYHEYQFKTFLITVTGLDHSHVLGLPRDTSRSCRIFLPCTVLKLLFFML